MESFFSDDRDIVISTKSDLPDSTRGATWRGTAVLLLIALSVVMISVFGGIFSDLQGRRFDQLSNDFVFCRGLELIFGVWVFAVGASVGSFLNVVAWRAPQGLSVNGHSFCPQCKTRISTIDNIPLVGWFRLRGRCFNCQLPIPFKYPLYEGIAGYLFLGLYALEFLSHGKNLPEGFMAASRYGLTTNLHMLTSEICWLFALHLVFLSGALACLMTHMEGGVLPAKYLLFWLFGTTLILLFYPQVGNSSLDWFQMERFSSTAAVMVRVIAVSCLALMACLAICIVRRRSEPLNALQISVFETDTTQTLSLMDGQSDCSIEKHAAHKNYRSTLWIVTSVMAILALGVIPGLLLMICAYLIELVFKLNRQDQGTRGTRFFSWEVWLVPSALALIINWRTINNWLS